MFVAVSEERLLIPNTLYVQSRFDAFADFRLLEDLEALMQMTQALGLGVTLSVAHDSAPPSGVHGTDLRLVSSVRLSF